MIELIWFFYYVGLFYLGSITVTYLLFRIFGNSKEATHKKVSEMFNL